MNNVNGVTALILLISLLISMHRIINAPSAIDSMLAAQLIGTLGVGIVLLVSQLLKTPGIIDTALVIALLASVTTITFVQKGLISSEEKERVDHDNS